jgi:hypothetical protein
MTRVEQNVENGRMPDSNWDVTDPIDRIDWQQIVKLGTGRERPPCAVDSQETS